MHIFIQAFFTKQAVGNIAQTAVSNIREYLETGKMKTNCATRYCLLHCAISARILNPYFSGESGKVLLDHRDPTGFRKY